MNLTNRDGFAAVVGGRARPDERFDWDGVNLAELYFESLEGHENPARFTPMNDDVRARVPQPRRASIRWICSTRLAAVSPQNAAGLARFLDFRADLAAPSAGRMDRPDRADSQDQAASGLGADARGRPVRYHHAGKDRRRRGPHAASAGPARFHVSDRRSGHHLESGPAALSADRRALPAAITPRQDKLAIDINVVERYQDVYPTKQQTGAELFQLVHLAAASFPRVALYFENSILAPDLPLLASPRRRT